MNNKLNSSFTKTLLALGIASATTLSHAGAFGLIENSASGQGSAFAGASALGEDASTIYFNPAGMTRLSGSQIIVVGHVIAPQTDFNNNGSTDALGAPLTGSDSNIGDPAFLPNIYYATELPNEIHVGVGVTVPFGLETDYDKDWVGRYSALKSEIVSINVNPAIAWKVTSKLAVGFGLSVQYIDLSLSNNIDSFAACVNLTTQAGSTTPGTDCFNAGLTGFGVASQDSKVKLTGDSLEIGWNAGLLYDVNDTNRIGVSYRSAIKHNVSGDANYNLNAGLQPFADGASAATGFSILQDTSLKANAELPETFSLSYVSEITPKWTALFDWTWTGWSKLDTIVIRQSGGVPGQEPTLNLAYDDTNRFSAGVNYQFNEKLILRTGVAYDETPIKSAETRSARIPGNNRRWASIGAGYAFSPEWTVDLGYSHLFMSDSDVNNNGGASSSGSTLIGTYDNTSVDIFSAQANYNF
ncbi:MAG: OmpP1/FadL family transporter [Gammaproteobacteria bacterium]|nr:OmpP1/FadL family transporter [Gammaproteobacteria bacterium]